MEFRTPVVFGVLTTDTVAQAIERADPMKMNRGADAAKTAIEMVNVMRLLGKDGKVEVPAPPGRSTAAPRTNRDEAEALTGAALWPLDIKPVNGRYRFSFNTTFMAKPARGWTIFGRSIPWPRSCGCSRSDWLKASELVEKSWMR